jgi:hypothetical protein
MPQPTTLLHAPSVIHTYDQKNRKAFADLEVTVIGTNLIQGSDSGKSQSWFGAAAEELKDTDSWCQFPRCCAM